MKGHGARADGGQKVVGILGGHDDDEVLRRLLQRLQERVGGLLVSPVDVIDQEDAAAAMQGFILRELLELSHLRDRDLAQRSIGREGYKIRMGREQERVFVALFSGPFFAVGHDGLVVGKAEVVFLNLLRVAQKRGGESPGQRGLPEPFRSREQKSLRKAFLAGELLQGLRDRRVAVKIGEHNLTWCHAARI